MTDTQEKRPILIFKGDPSLCYGIMEAYSRSLRDALVSLGEEVIYLDPQKDEVQPYIDRTYKAVIAFMENLFYMVLDNGDFIFDHFHGPKFNYWTDHPAFYYRYVQRVPKRYYILTQDRTYVRYIDRYFKNVKAFCLLPGGREPEAKELIPFENREYDVSFVGTFWKGNVLDSFDTSDETTRIIMERYLEFLVAEPDYTAEDAFEKVLESLGAKLSDDDFAREFEKVHRLASKGAARIYRQRVIEKIVERGITIHVFGDSWREAPFADSKCLIIHDEVPSDKITDIYLNSKISLNIMTWHKDSITERVLDAMMAGSIVLSDRTPALEEAFDNGKEILLFSLRNLEELPGLITGQLEDRTMAEAGRKRAVSSYSWKCCAERLLGLIEDEQKGTDQFI